MRNRWHHIPLLHTTSSPEKKATWLELFYDLIYVAAFIQLGNGLAKQVSLSGFLAFAALFTPLWVAWTGFTFFVNRYTVDDFLHRLLVFTKMFAVGAMAVMAPAVLEGRIRGFALAYAVAQSMVALLYFRAYREQPKGRDYSRYWGMVFALGAIIWLVSVWVPTPFCYGMWGIGVSVVLAAPFNRHSRALLEQYPNDFEHLSERYGLLTLIVLGESFVKVLSSLTSISPTAMTLMQAMFVLLITCCLWWIYFDDVAGSHVKKVRLASFFWLYAHLPFQIGVTSVGVAIKKAVEFDLTLPAPYAYRWFLGGTLALTFISVGIIDSVTERRQSELDDRLRVMVRTISGLILLLLTAVGHTMSALWFLGVLTAISLVQILIDVMSAPFESVTPHESLQTHTTAHRFHERMAQGSTAKRRDVGSALRKGTPSHMRKDLYFFLMEGSWWRLIGALAAAYVTTNIVFAALYLMEPGSVLNAGQRSFADAFFFSVQTMTTIGFGGMMPATAYGNMVVTVEAAVGLMGVALATGLMFARVSRPRTSVLFSSPMVVTTMNGLPTLAFRVGNARGNDIVDASISLSMLLDTESDEGHHVRQIIDVPLVRSKTPFFTLTWLVMHRLDEDSPLKGLDLTSDPRVFGFLVTLIGHDGTYAQTVYARHNYEPEDILPNHRFIDVIHELEDGRLMVDYDVFHDTIPE